MSIFVYALIHIHIARACTCLSLFHILVVRALPLQLFALALATVDPMALERADPSGVYGFNTFLIQYWFHFGNQAREGKPTKRSKWPRARKLKS